MSDLSPTVTKAYTAAIDSGAILDNARFVAGSSPGTISKEALIALWNMLNFAAAPGAERTADDPVRPPSWLDLFTPGYPVALSERNGTGESDLAQYNVWFERARPAQKFMDQLVSMPFQLSQASKGEKIRLTTGATASLGASAFIAFVIQSGTHDPAMLDTVAALGAVGTSVRQFWISRTAGRERLQALARVGPRPGPGEEETRPVGPIPVKWVRNWTWLTNMLQRSVATDPASTARSNRLRYIFNMVGAHTYDVSILTDVSQAITALGLHGAALADLRVADGITALGLGMVYILYGRNLLTPRLGPDGKFYADPEFKNSKFTTFMVDLARVPLGLGGAANIVEFSLFHRPAFTLATSSDVIANYVRNLTSVDKAAGVWGRQRRLNRVGMKVMGKWYEAYDLLAATWPGNWGTIFASTYGESTAVAQGSRASAGGARGSR